MKAYKFVETLHYWGEDGPVTDTTVFMLDAEKLKVFAKTNDYEYRYIAHLIEKADAGMLEVETIRKFSFSDTPPWWDQLKPEGTPTEVVEVLVTIDLDDNW